MLSVYLRYSYLRFAQHRLFCSASSSLPSSEPFSSSEETSLPSSLEPVSDTPEATENDLYRFSKVVPYDRALPKEFLDKINEYLKDHRYNKKTATLTHTHAANPLIPHLHYIATRSPLEYAVIDRVLRETKKLLPGWTPESVFDVGAKLNNVLWCVKSVWGEEDIKTYTCVEDSQQWVKTSKEITDTSELSIKFFRQLQLTSDPDMKRREMKREENERLLLTSSGDRGGGKKPALIPKEARLPFVSADLAVCAYHLENVGVKKRKTFLRELWKRTDNVLVLIEPSFDLISEAREFLLREYDDCTVVAPCGHDKPCPMLRSTLLTGVKHECFFSHRLMKTFLPFRSPLKDNNSSSSNVNNSENSSKGGKKQKNSDVVLERFSYLVLRRKGSFNLSLPPQTDMSESISPLDLSWKKQHKEKFVEEKKTEEDLEYEKQLEILEKAEMEKLSSLTKEQVIEMFSIQRPSRDPMTMRLPGEEEMKAKEEEEEDEFTKGWYTEEEELPIAPDGVYSKAAERQRRTEVEQDDGEEEAVEEEEEGEGKVRRSRRRAAESEDEDDDLLMRKREELEVEEEKDLREEINYVPKKTWYSQKWARVLSPPDKKIRHLVLDLCTPAGELDKQVLGKSQPTYRLARHLRWGDIWGFERPASKKDSRSVRTWKFKNQQRKELKAQGKWAEMQAELQRKKETREKKLIEQGLLDEEERSKLTNQKLPKSERKKRSISPKLGS